MRNMGGLFLVAGALVFGTSAVLFGAAVVDAVRVEDATGVRTSGQQVMPGAGTGDAEAGADGNVSAMEAGSEEASVASGEGAGEILRSPRGQIYPQVTSDEILGAVNQDLFQPDRTPSVDRYLLPSERAAPAPRSRDNRRRRDPDLRIVGTAIAGDLALALVQPDDSLPFAVLMGETVEGYTLAAVMEEFVTLVREDQEWTLPVTEPRSRRSSNSRERNARSQEVQADLVRQLTERLREATRGGQQGRQRGGGGQTPYSDAVTFQFGGERGLVARPVIIRRPGGDGSGGGGTSGGTGSGGGGEGGGIR